MHVAGSEGVDDFERARDLRNGRPFVSRITIAAKDAVTLLHAAHGLRFSDLRNFELYRRSPRNSFVGSGSVWLTL